MTILTTGTIVTDGPVIPLASRAEFATTKQAVSPQTRVLIE